MTALLRTGTLVLGFGLIVLGIGAIVLPGPSSLSYGVATAEPTWVAAAGLRDLVLGLIVLGLRARHPAALRFVLLPSIVLPVGDVVLVLLAGMPLVSTLPHVLGALVIAALSVLAWREAPR